MRRRRSLLALLAVLLLAGGVALVPGLRESDDGPETGESGATPPAKTADRAADPRPAPRRAAPGAIEAGGTEAADAPEAAAQESAADAVIEGVVTRADTGAPVAGVTIHLRVFTVEGACIASGHTLVTDEAGRFRDDVETGSTFLYAQGAGWVSRGLAETEGTSLRLLRGTNRCDLVVEPAARIVGRVLDADGRPVAGAVVTTGFMGGSVGATPDDIATDEAGRFVLPDLVPGVAYWVWAETETCAPAVQPNVTAASGATAEIELRLPPPRAVEVVVVDDATGAPLAGVFVKAATVDESPSSHGASAVTDDLGRALVVAIPPGVVLLEVVAPDHLPPLPDDSRFEPNEGLGGAVARREIRLRREASAEVAVVGPDGNRLPGCRVRVWTDDGTREVYDARTGPDGTKLIPQLDPEKTYRVEVDASGTIYNVVSRRIDGWTPGVLEVRLEPGLSVEGIVVDLAGRPLSGVKVRVNDGAVDDALSDASSRFRAVRLVPGDVRLVAAVDGDLEFAPPRETRVAAGAPDVRVVQDPRASVSVRFSESVRSFDHEVVVVDASAGRSRRLTVSSRSRERRVAGLAPGERYRIRWADWSGGRWALAEFTAGKDSEVSLTLQPGRPLAGRVILPQGATDLRSLTLHRDGLACDVTIGPDGRFRVPGLAPGTWRLFAWAETNSDDDDTVRVETDVEAGREDVVLDLRATTK